jgi:hypothetical protein
MSTTEASSKDCHRGGTPCWKHRAEAMEYQVERKARSRTIAPGRQQDQVVPADCQAGFASDQREWLRPTRPCRAFLPLQCRCTLDETLTRTLQPGDLDSSFRLRRDLLWSSLQLTFEFTRLGNIVFSPCQGQVCRPGRIRTKVAVI